MISLRIALGLAAATLMGSASADNGCTNPGEYQCAVMLYSSSFDFPDPFHWDESESYYAHVVDGNCNQIDTSGSLQPLGSGNGFSANFQTSYNTEVDVYASEMGADSIEGVTFTYEGQNYDQSGCSSGYYGFDPAVSYVQCNFGC